MEMFLSAVILLLVGVQSAGSPVSVYRPTGGSVTLEFQGHQQLEKKRLDYVRWYCGQETIMKYVPLRDTVTVFTHQDRVEFNKETFSLELKNLQKNDSGLYRGEISAHETEFMAEYRLSVLAGSPVSVFRPTGGSVTLEFQGHQQLEKKSIDLIQWYFGLEKIMKYVPLRDSVTVFTHQDRVEFNEETFSLELKNLQKNDSGLYRGEIYAVKTGVKAEYRLSVLDPVESPVLSDVSNWTGCDSCIVTCKGHDLSLTSTCDCSTCSSEGGASIDSTLSLSVRSGVVICNYSNLVSWSIDAKDIKLLCPTEQSVTSWIGIIIAIAILGVAVLIAVLWRKSANLDPIRCCRESGETHSETGTGG